MMYDYPQYDEEIYASAQEEAEYYAQLEKEYWESEEVRQQEAAYWEEEARRLQEDEFDSQMIQSHYGW